MAKKKDFPPHTRLSERLAKWPKDDQRQVPSGKVKSEHLWNISQSTSWALDYSDEDGPNTQDFHGL